MEYVLTGFQQSDNIRLYVFAEIEGCLRLTGSLSPLTLGFYESIASLFKSFRSSAVCFWKSSGAL